MKKNFSRHYFLSPSTTSCLPPTTSCFTSTTSCLPPSLAVTLHRFLSPLFSVLSQNVEAQDLMFTMG